MCNLKIRKSAGSDRTLMAMSGRNLTWHAVSGRSIKKFFLRVAPEPGAPHRLRDRGCHRRGEEKYLCRVWVGASYRVAAEARRTGLPRPGDKQVFDLPR